MLVHDKIRHCISNGDYIKAEELILQNLSKEGESQEILKQYIILLTDTSQWENLITKSKEYIEKFPQKAFGYKKLIKALYKVKEFNQANKIINDCLSGKLSNFSNWDKVNLYKYLNKFYSIRKLATRVSKNSPNKIIWVSELLSALNKLNEDIGLQEELLKKIFSISILPKVVLIQMLELARNDYGFRGKIIRVLESSYSKQLENYNLLRRFTRIKNIDYQIIDVEDDFSKNKVDIVYTWVDMADEVFIQRFYNQNGRYPEDIKDRQQGVIRYFDNGEIRVSLLSVQKHFSVVNNIYIVTNGQSFSLDFLQNEFQEKIKFIDTRTIIPPDLVKGDVFNSNLIESFLHKIDGLTDTFLYFCDDFILADHLSISDIFTKDGRSYVTNGEDDFSMVDSLEGKLLYNEKNNIAKVLYPSFIKNALDLYISRYGEEPFLRDIHQVMIMSKKACELTLELYKNDWKEDFFKDNLRGNNSIFTLLLYNWIGVKEGFQTYDPSKEFRKRSLLVNTILNAEVLQYIVEVKPLFLCLNMGYIDDESKASYLKLEEYFS